jgi:hypothetical protein
MKIGKFSYAGFTLVLIAGMMLSSCNLVSLDEVVDKPEVYDPTTIPGSIEEFNAAFHGGSSKSWATVSFTLAGLSGIQACRLDDTIEINADGTYRYNGGVVLCGAEDNQKVKTGTWEVINDGNNILFDEGTEREYTAIVNGFDQNTLSISGLYLGINIKGIYKAN